MKWTDNDESAEPSKNTSDIYFEDDAGDDWGQQEQEAGATAGSGSRPFFMFIGLVVVAGVAVLLFFLLRGGSNTGLERRIEAVEERIDVLEEKINRFETIDQKVTRIWQQAKSFEKFKARFDRSEASMSLRMDHLTMSLEDLQQKIASLEKEKVTVKASVTKPQTKKKARPSVIKYHQVKAGDTLFSISRRYGLTVEQLLKMNKMGKADVIRIGQKLVVKTKSE